LRIRGKSMPLIFYLDVAKSQKNRQWDTAG
jgi:hypothetical protein